MTEITERLEASLSDDGRSRLLIDSIDDYAIYMLDPTGKVASWNPGARRFKGYEAAEIIGQNFERFYSEEDRASGLPARALATAAREGRFENEGWRIRKDGTRFWANVVIDPILSPSGHLIGFAKVTRDLTERRKAEELLRHSQEQFRLLVQGVSDYAIYMLDRDGNVSTWNAGAERIKQYSADEIIGSHFSRFYTSEDRETGEPAKALAAALAEGRFEKEGWRVRKDGTRFWANVVIDPIRHASGEVVGFAKITRDITERRDSQIALEVAREQLAQSQKLEAIGQLTGGVAHDFNNLLMAILSSLELVQKYLPDDPKVTRLISNAVQGAQRGATLTQRMLAFARRQPLKSEAVDVKKLVESLVELIEPTLSPETHIETRFAERLPAALTDANQLETALLNLCVNARDAMPEGGTIAIDVHEKVLHHPEQGLPAGRYVILCVIDHGEGMDEETLKKATEPFFTTKGVGKGSGLGLPMVHGLAAQSGGKLLLKSGPGLGTTAELWLPVAPATEAEDQATAPAPLAAANGALRILAVDDDALILMNTVMMLEDIGHSVCEAHNGAGALKILESGEPIDVVISDHAMPGMSGSQLAAVIREKWPGMPVILATGYAELPPGSATDLPRLSKPFSQADLSDAVAAVALR